MENANAIMLIIDNSGIEKSKTEIIKESILKFIDKIPTWDNLNKSINIDSIEQKADMKLAKATRLNIRAERLAGEKFIDSKRKEVQDLMSGFTLEDKMWLKLKQEFSATCKIFEDELETKEKFAERYEAEQKAKLTLERTEKLAEYCDFPASYNVAELSEPAFNDLLEGLKLQKQAKIDAELKEEQARIEKAAAEKAEQERIRLENEKLKADAIQKEKEAEIERQKQAKIEQELKAKRDEEEAERLRIEAENKAKQDAELKASQAPDKEKLTNWIIGIEFNPIDVSAEKSIKVRDLILEKYNLFIESSLNLINVL